MEGVDKVNFAFADTHGDINIRLSDKGKFVYGFSTMNDLSELLKEMDMIEEALA